MGHTSSRAWLRDGDGGCRAEWNEREKTIALKNRMPGVRVRSSRPLEPGVTLIALAALTRGRVEVFALGYTVIQQGVDFR